MTKQKQDVEEGNVAQSRKDGTMTTEEGKVVDAQTGVVTDEDGTNDKARVLSFEEVETLVGDLEPGDEGWVPLNDKGEITGPAQKGNAPIGELSAKVYMPPDARVPPLTTPSGALLSHRMNPDTSANISERPRTEPKEEADE